MYSGIKGLIQEIRAGELSEVAKELFPDLYDLAHNWDRNTDEYNGYLIGKMVGNYGASILTPIGAAKILQMLRAAKAARIASKLAPVGVASTGIGVAEAEGIRIIQRGERVADLVQELARRTYTSGGMEHAIISLQSGERVIVRGGRGGIDFASFIRDLRRVIIHTHPTTTGPSAVDLEMLRQLGQRSSYIYELFGGGLTKFFKP
jgi:hypothetical protein